MIPTYERRDTVVRAARSALAQTRSDLEVIVVDDGSADGTAEALDGLDGRLRYVRRDVRGGPSAARNAALALARAPVVAFLDSDNIWLPDHVETVLGALEQHPPAVLASTAPHFMAGRERPSDARLVDPLPESLVSNFVGYLSSIAVRRDAALEVGGFDERLWVAEDGDLWARLSLLGPFAFVRRRTMIRGKIPDGLRALGRIRGDYLPALCLSAEHVLAEVERRQDERSRAAVEAARAAVHLARAMSALSRREAPVVREELARACLLLPELSSRPDLMHWRIWDTAPADRDFGPSLELAAASWPEPRSDTALVLRATAAGLALREGRLRAAAALASAPPSVVSLRVARILGSALGRHARRRLRRLGEALR